MNKLLYVYRVFKKMSAPKGLASLSASERDVMASVMLLCAEKSDVEIDVLSTIGMQLKDCF